MLIVIDETFAHLKSQVPIVDAYNSLSININMSFQRVFKQLSELQISARLASDARPSNTSGGEGANERERRIQWKPISEFVLRDEWTDEQILDVETLKPHESCDEEDEKLTENAILGLQAIREQPVKVLLDADKLK